MLNKRLRQAQGFTYVELMVAVAIIAIISVLSVVYLRAGTYDEIKNTSRQMVADIKYTRNLAVSRKVYDFAAPYPDLGEVYPPGGYGIYFQQLPVARYFIYADSGEASDDLPYRNDGGLGYDPDKDPIIKDVTIDIADVVLVDTNSIGKPAVYFAFVSEGEVDTNFTPDSGGRYEVQLDYPGPGYPENGLISLIILGETSDDQYIWSNLGESYSEYTPPPPPSPRDDPGSGISL